MRARRWLQSCPAAFAVLAVGLAGCGGSGLEGTYTGGDDSLLDSLTFRSGGIVDVRIANGLGGEGTYVVDGDEVAITANGTTHVLTIGPDGCLRGTVMVGTLCRADALGGAAASGNANGLTGTYEATTPDGSMTLELRSGNRARFTITDASGTEADDVTYRVSGDRILMTGASGESMTLTRAGDRLEADMGGLVLRFSRR